MLPRTAITMSACSNLVVKGAVNSVENKNV